MAHKIMIIDDEPLITATLTTLLELMISCETVAYNDPLEALDDKWLKTQELDMVISDFLMPQMDGFEFLKQVQKEVPACISILLTGYADKDNAIKCINEIDLYYYLEKPWQNDDLLKIISNALEKKQLESDLAIKVSELEKANQKISRLYDILQDDFDLTVNENSQLHERLMKRNFDLQNILDNVDQGFLMVDHTLKICPDYSEKCIDLLMSPIEGRSFPALIAGKDAEQCLFLEQIMADILTGTQQEHALLMPLLPEEIRIQGKVIALSFKILQKSKQEHLANPENAFIVMLTDITEKKKLESLIEQERNTLKMVVEAISNFRGLKEAIRDYHFFIASDLPSLVTSQLPAEEVIGTVFRQVHTFKGTFSQLNLIESTDAIHMIENELADMMTSKSQSTQGLKKLGLSKVMDKDLAVLDHYLGEEFLNIEEQLIIDKMDLLDLEKSLIHAFDGPLLDELLEKLHSMRYRPIEELLTHYVPYVARLSENLNKPMAPLRITGGALAVDHEIYRDFTKSLIHVIRNMMDHGIESIERRAEIGKSDLGHISIEIVSNTSEIVIIIENDGTPLAIDDIRRKASQLQGRTLDHLSDDETLMLIFEDQLTTSDQVNQISGRGMGLSAVKYEVDRLGGEVAVESSDELTRFIFKLPHVHGYVSYGQLGEYMVRGLRIYLKQYQEDVKIKMYQSDLPHGLMGACISLHGLVDCQICLYMSPEHVKFLIGYDYSDDQEDILQEGIKEVLNTILGNSLQIIPGTEHYVDLSSPFNVDARMQFSEKNYCYIIEGEHISLYLSLDY